MQATSLHSPVTKPERPPGPRGWPLLGNMPAFARNPLQFLTQVAREYGDIAHYRVLNFPIYQLNNPRDIEHVLVRTNSVDFDKTPGGEGTPGALLFGNGLLSSTGDFWLRQRRLAQPAFHRQRIAAYAETITDYSTQMLNGWRAGEERELLQEMMMVTLDIVVKTLFNTEIGNGRAQQIGDAFNEIMQAFMDMRKLLAPLPLWLPLPAHRRFRRAVAKLDEVVYAVIQKRRISGEDRGDLLSMLLQVRDEDGSGMTNKQLRDETLTMFLAGHETTALALTWAWYLLAQHPEVEDKLQRELAEVLNGRTPTLADLPKLAYTEKILKETMRLYPPAWSVDGRRVLKDTELSGYTIPKGAMLFMSQWVMHRHPAYFPEPERFHPERWTEEFSKQLPHYAYFPFGGGPHICIGASFAMMEATLILATMAQRFRFELLPGQQVTPQPSITLRPKQGVRVRLASVVRSQWAVVR